MAVVEVFKTNVQDASCAEKILHMIRQLDLSYDASFDLEDCDRILRIDYKNGPIDCSRVLLVLRQMGFCAEVLED